VFTVAWEQIGDCWWYCAFRPVTSRDRRDKNFTADTVAVNRVLGLWRTGIVCVKPYDIDVYTLDRKRAERGIAAR